MELLEKRFKFTDSNTNVKTEILAGITTFMTIAYILIVNADILGDAGMDRSAVFTATTIAAFIGTMLMGLLASYPLALAPGMGLNSFFAYTVVRSMGHSWQFTLYAVFIESIIFILLTLTNIREEIINCIPPLLKHAVTVGITGLTAVTTGFLFLASLFFAPIFTIIPPQATGPVLILVGY